MLAAFINSCCGATNYNLFSCRLHDEYTRRKGYWIYLIFLCMSHMHDCWWCMLKLTGLHVTDDGHAISSTNHLSLFCLFLSTVPEHTKSRQSPKPEPHPLFPLPTFTPTHLHPRTNTNAYTYSPQQCQRGLISLLPALTSPASSPQTLEAVPSELWPLTSPLLTWEPEVSCSLLNPWTPSCPARSLSHEPYSQVNNEKKGKRTSKQQWITLNYICLYPQTHRDVSLHKHTVCQ